jgi:DNA-3-methyladenine glycosylase
VSSPIRGRVLPRSFYARDSRTVAPDLLNKVLVRGARAVRIVEVEAYAGGEDPASHAYRGPTLRNEVMFGPAGHLYVYFTYGMHWCANAVCGEPGVASAVLVRAGSPLAGLDEMRAVRPAARRDRDLASGPAKLCQALGIDGELNGADLAAPRGARAGERGIAILDDGVAPPDPPAVTGRVGLSVGVESPWRWYVPDDPNVSRGPRS